MQSGFIDGFKLAVEWWPFGLFALWAALTLRAGAKR